jgi:hypothetical protein
MASFSENAWDALNGALSVCRGQMAGPATTMGQLRDGHTAANWKQARAMQHLLASFSTSDGEPPGGQALIFKMKCR